MTYNLNQTDKSFLYRKYTKLGMTPKEAYDNVKKLSEHLNFLVSKLKAKKINEKEIEIKFREEFEKICMNVEGKFW